MYQIMWEIYVRILMDHYLIVLRLFDYVQCEYEIVNCLHLNMNGKCMKIFLDI
jgi:hypothetical protein